MTESTRAETTDDSADFRRETMRRFSCLEECMRELRAMLQDERRTRTHIDGGLHGRVMQHADRIDALERGNG